MKNIGSINRKKIMIISIAILIILLIFVLFMFNSSLLQLSLLKVFIILLLLSAIVGHIVGYYMVKLLLFKRKINPKYGHLKFIFPFGVLSILVIVGLFCSGFPGIFLIHLTMLSAEFLIDNTIVGEITKVIPELLYAVISAFPFFGILTITVFILTYSLAGYLYSACSKS